MGMKIDKARNDKTTVDLTQLGSLEVLNLFADSGDAATREGHVGLAIDIQTGIEESTPAKNKIVHLF
jgi:hypothetical protein